jgi:hypothetical protein
MFLGIYSPDCDTHIGLMPNFHCKCNQKNKKVIAILVQLKNNVGDADKCDR